jgi:hypothetical protein
VRNKNIQLVRERDARLALTMRKRQVLASPLGGLQVIAAHLNELPGQRAQVVESGCPNHVKGEVAAWEIVERIVSLPLAHAAELFNSEAKRLAVFMQVELAPEEPHPFLASPGSGDRLSETLRHLWWYYFRDQGWTRLKRCPVCLAWFVDTAKNKSTTRCSTACTAKWWTRSRRKQEGHKQYTTSATQPGGSHGTKRR